MYKIKVNQSNLEIEGVFGFACHVDDAIIILEINYTYKNYSIFNILHSLYLKLNVYHSFIYLQENQTLRE